MNRSNFLPRAAALLLTLVLMVCAALPGFAALADFHYPPYTVEKTLRELYTPARPHTDCPRIPEPYNTFAETFSYGV